jgi:hypothetical protein
MDELREIQARFVGGPRFAELYGTLDVRPHGTGCLVDVHPHVANGDVPSEFIAEAMEAARLWLSEFGVPSILTITQATCKEHSRAVDFKMCGGILVQNALGHAGMNEVINQYYAAKRDEEENSCP